MTAESVRTYLSGMPDLPTAFTDAIRDRYLVERKIGAGGMATVHLARDMRHNREVAIKVLKPALAASLGADRFLKEIEIAARLTHPHIIPLHDSGEAAGFLYYVMPFIDGGSLRTRLDRETRLEAEEALGIIEKVGDALSYAHRQGILHRDIKPENILFSEDHPMVADFGIARAVSTAGGEKLTRTGVGLGTPGYMSPEQAAGERDLDARTDVFSLGSVLFEMLLGEPPSMWQSDEASLERGKFVDLPERHRARMRELDRSTERALVAALAMRARDRFESVDAFLAALRAEAGEGRHYRDSVAKKIMQLAAEDQAAHPTEDWMSLGTLQEIGADVGISAERVERAARELEGRGAGAPQPESGPGAFWLGSPTQIAAERWVDGEVDESAHDEIVDEVQATFSAEGEVSRLGRSLTWNAVKPVLGKTRAVQVRVTPRAGRTRIQVQERLGELAVTLYSSILVGGGIGGIATILAIGLGWLGIDLESWLLTAVWLPGMYALTRSIFRGVSRHKRTELEELRDRIAELASESARGRLDSSETPGVLPG